MKKIIFILSLYSSIIYGWDSDAAKFYPLAIGNVWSYHHIQLGAYPGFFCIPHSNSDYIISITGDTILSNGKKYYKFSNGNLERIDSATMIAYRYIDSTEYKLDSLLARKNDHYYGIRMGFNYTNCVVNDTPQYNLFNISWRSKSISVNSSFHSYYLVNGIGVAYVYICYYTGYEEYLNGCIINGIQYGNIVGISKRNSEISGKFSLSQNYPNPFNPSTKIKFSIPQMESPLYGAPSGSRGAGGFITMKIYDILGREVTILVNEKLNPGTYEVEWNGGNYPSGVYFYKLNATSGTTEFTETKKMVLIK